MNRNKPCPAWSYAKTSDEREYCDMLISDAVGATDHVHSDGGITQEEYDRRLAEYKNTTRKD